ncbi:MAG: FG-GAP-like repeat-containing protein [Phycisphaerales bacterium]|nr:FG-GAP-like repeat-containing protein [Phycisphaerales bacterium]
MSTPDPNKPAQTGRDEVIGRAFWRSLAVLLLLAVVIAGSVIAYRFLKSGDQTTVDETEVAMPSGPTAADRREVVSIPFDDVAGAWNVDFVHRSGATGEKLMPETLGGGVAIADLDGDDRPDLVFVDGGSKAAFNTEPHAMVVVYRNVPGPDGEPRFERQDSIPDIPGYGMGVAAGDVDGDGDIDLYVTTLGQDRLLINEQTDGQIVLRDASREWGIPEENGWSTAVGFADLDGDEDLDLVGLKYIAWSPEIDREVDFRFDGIGRAYGPPTGFRGTEPFLLINEGGRVREDGLARGLRQVNPATGDPVGKGLGLAIVDLDLDGDLDLVGANDTTANAAWINDGNGHFVESAIPLGLAFDRNGMATGAMGIDVSHYCGGDVLGIAVGNFANEPTSLFVSRPGFPGFVDEGVLEGIAADTRSSLTFGLLFADLDLDGCEDLVQANGHLEEEISIVQPSQSYRQSAQVFRNMSGPGSSGPAFAHVPAAQLGDLSSPMVGRGLASGDLDLDGDLDLVLTQINGPPLVLRNVASDTPASHRVRLRGRAPNTQAIGAEVVVQCGDRTMRRTVMPTRSYLSQVEEALLFATLGEEVDRIEVRWPDGSRTSLLEGIEGDSTTIQQLAQ